MARALTFALAMPIGPAPCTGGTGGTGDNGHPLLEQALRSVAAQTRPVRLAVLDASGSPAVAAALDRHAGLIAHRRTGPDAGQAAAIQEGWDALDADIHGWLNADDLLYPDALALAARHFAARPDAGVVTGQSLFFDHDAATGAFTFTGLHPEVRPPGDSLFRTNTVSQPSTFIRRTALERVGGLDTALHYTMDWDLWARLHAAGIDFAFEPAPLSAVLMAPGTKTSAFNAARRREIAAIVARHAGMFAAWKSLFGFWLTHRADAEPGRGVFTRLRDALRSTRGPVAASRNGETWPLLHYADTPLTQLTARAPGPVTLTLPETDSPFNAAPGQPLPVAVPPATRYEISFPSSDAPDALVLAP